MFDIFNLRHQRVTKGHNSDLHLEYRVNGLDRYKGVLTPLQFLYERTV